MKRESWIPSPAYYWINNSTKIFWKVYESLTSIMFFDLKILKGYFSLNCKSWNVIVFSFKSSRITAIKRIFSNFVSENWTFSNKLLFKLTCWNSQFVKLVFSHSILFKLHSTIWQFSNQHSKNLDLRKIPLSNNIFLNSNLKNLLLYNLLLEIVSFEKDSPKQAT